MQCFPKFLQKVGYILFIRIINAKQQPLCFMQVQLSKTSCHWQFQDMQCFKRRIPPREINLNKLLRSLIIINNSQRHKTSDRAPENPTLTFQSKEIKSDTKAHVPPKQDHANDFCIDDATIKSYNIHKNSLTRYFSRFFPDL